VARFAADLHERRWTSSKARLAPSATLDAVEGFLARAGIRGGDTVMVHSAWEPLSSGRFGAGELVKRLLAVVGPEGTLAMPAFPPNSAQVSGAVFDVRRTPSAGGLLTEAFRRYPGVKRSINLNHSVCAIGPNADFLTQDHHRSETSWDAFSPYFRLREIDDAWIIGLGVGHRLKVATSLHCVESALWKENAYFRKLFRDEVCYSYKTATGEMGQHCYKRRVGQIYTPKLAKHFASDELMEDCIEGLEVYAIRARPLIDKAIALGREGKTMYVWPVPWPWYFRSRSTRPQA
jgi:aminoglycoside 3-N-acetyltransferase